MHYLTTVYDGIYILKSVYTSPQLTKLGIGT